MYQDGCWCSSLHILDNRMAKGKEQKGVLLFEGSFLKLLSILSAYISLTRRSYLAARDWEIYYLSKHIATLNKTGFLILRKKGYSIEQQAVFSMILSQSSGLSHPNKIGFAL